LCGGDDEKNELVCIDHFDLMKTDAGRCRWETFQENLSSTGLSDRVRIIPEFSTPALFKLMNEMMNQEQMGFNLVYIDGSHRADDTLLDAEMAWRMASEGCILVFDDYEWNQAEERTIYHPKSGINAFLKVHNGEYSMLNKGYQIMIRKEVPRRLGFLSEEDV
jgi:predicted O-methyltransferase YrrM